MFYKNNYTLHQNIIITIHNKICVLRKGQTSLALSLFCLRLLLFKIIALIISIIPLYEQTQISIVEQVVKNWLYRKNCFEIRDGIRYRFTRVKYSLFIIIYIWKPKNQYQVLTNALLSGGLLFYYAYILPQLMQICGEKKQDVRNTNRSCHLLIPPIAWYASSII